MTLYRKKPLQVEARQYIFATDAKELAEWAGGRIGNWLDSHDNVVVVIYLSGDRIVKPFDWIVKDSTATWIVPEEQFESQYEQVATT